jgi:hypothetical protein
MLDVDLSLAVLFLDYSILENAYKSLAIFLNPRIAHIDNPIFFQKNSIPEPLDRCQWIKYNASNHLLALLVQ